MDLFLVHFAFVVRLFTPDMELMVGWCWEKHGTCKSDCMFTISDVGYPSWFAAALAAPWLLPAAPQMLQEERMGPIPRRTRAKGASLLASSLGEWDPTLGGRGGPEAWSLTQYMHIYMYIYVYIYMCIYIYILIYIYIYILYPRGPHCLLYCIAYRIAYWIAYSIAY